MANPIKGFIASLTPWGDRRDANLKKQGSRIERLMRKRWAKQQAAVLAALKLTSIAEAETDGERELPAGVLAQITGALGKFGATAAEIALFDGQIVAALKQGQKDAAASLKVSRPPGNESFEVRYLRTAGFSKLSGDLDATSVKQLADAVSAAYRDGADYDKIVQVVKGKFAEFSQYRAQLIAQTELNDAYNRGILRMGLDAGAEYKSWEIWASDACIICVLNSGQDEIPIGDVFLSGDQAAPGHPGCRCSVRLHA